MGRIFICYRREDSAGFTRAIHDRLAGAFPNDAVFMDVETIEPGQEFSVQIQEEVRKSDVFIAVIGKRWFTAADDAGRRLDRPNDYVRQEIATALTLGITVIPLLLDGAAMPGADALPDDLKALAGRNALGVTHARFTADIETLQTAIGSRIGREPASTTVDVDTAHPEGSTGTTMWIVGGAAVFATIVFMVIVMQSGTQSGSDAAAITRFLVLLAILGITVYMLASATTLVLRLRGRNLLYGLRTVVASVLDLPDRHSRELAARILNESSNSLRRRQDPSSFLWRILGPNVSQIDASDLPELLSRLGAPVDANVVEEFEKQFFKIAGALRDRYVFMMRVITFCWAMLVAFALQANASYLLGQSPRDLTSTPVDLQPACEPGFFDLWSCGVSYYYSFGFGLDYSHVFGSLITAVLIFLVAIACRVMYEIIVHTQTMRRIQ